MALLNIKIKGKVYITWGTSSLVFIRNVMSTQSSMVTYAGAIGQKFTSGQTLYTNGVYGSPGYVAIKSASDATLNGSGNFYINVEHYPISTEGNKTLVFNVDESPMKVNLSYNSQPNVTDIIVETPNRTPYVFLLSDFTSHYSDFDNDQIAAIQINGDTTGFYNGGSSVVAGEWINIQDVTNGLLKYVPLDQSEYYEKGNTWKAKDSQGNISVN